MSQKKLYRGRPGLDQADAHAQITDQLTEREEDFEEIALAGDDDYWSDLADKQRRRAIEDARDDGLDELFDDVFPFAL